MSDNPRLSPGAGGEPDPAGSMASPLWARVVAILLFVLTAVIVVAIALIVIGVKGFAAMGIPLMKEKSMHGRTGQLVGIACILAGMLSISGFCLALYMFR